MKIKNIRISGLLNPKGFDEKEPVVSWEIEQERNDGNIAAVRQKSYEVEVWEAEECVWKSGRVQGEEQQIILEKIHLKPCTIYKVRVCVLLIGNAGKEWKTEETTEWETGFLHRKKWDAKWIGPKRVMRQNVGLEDILAIMNPEIKTKKKPEDSVKDLYPVVRFDKKVLLLEKPVKKARIYATARGVYEISVDGNRVGEQELAPEFTAYDKYLQYQTYDVTEYIKDKETEVSIWLADGYYVGRIGMIGLGYEYGDHISFLLQMEIEYEDGEKQIIASDESWKYTETNILYSDIFIGEKQDLTMEEREAKEIPEVFQENMDNLVGQAAEPLRILEELPAKEILTTPKGETVIDFGQVLCGKVRLCLCGKRGEEIILEHQETLDRDGNFFFNIPRFNCEQQDIFILTGEKEEVSPRFTIHGFRYVRISGYSGALEVSDCKALVIGSDCEKTGDFKCSDERLNQLQHNIEWSQKSNFVSIPMDCPQRERAGWTGDIQIYGETACYNAYVLPFLKRWLSQVRLEQDERGVVPVVVPYSVGYQNMQKQFQGDTSAGWGDVCVILPWMLYRAYGDLSILKDNFEMMEKWLAYVEKEAAHLPEDGVKEEEKQYQKYLWNTGFHYGDWLYPSAKNEEGASDGFLSSMTTRSLVPPMMYAYSVQTMIKVCKALGKENEAKYYETVSGNIKEAYRKVYVQEDGSIFPELQGVYVLALYMDLIPEKLKEKTVAKLVQLIKENNGCLDTGFLSVPFLLDVLYENGYKNLAYEMLYNEHCPSWLYEVKMGATTMWESWDALREDGTPNVTSFNHYAFGCVGSWIYRTILGIRCTSPGYKTFVIQPDFCCGLTWAKGSYHCVYGEISVQWEKRKTNY